VRQLAGVSGGGGSFGDGVDPPSIIVLEVANLQFRTWRVRGRGPSGIPGMRCVVGTGLPPSRPPRQLEDSMGARVTDLTTSRLL